MAIKRTLPAGFAKPKLNPALGPIDDSGLQTRIDIPKYVYDAVAPEGSAPPAPPGPGAPGGGAAPSGAPNQTAEDVWNLLNKDDHGGTYIDWVDTYKQAILDLFPRMQKWARGGDVLGALDLEQRPGAWWNRLLVQEAVDPSKGPIYSRTGEAEGLQDYAQLVAPLGLAGQMPAGSRFQTSDPMFGRYDEVGRYLGKKTGYFPGYGWVW